jgi:hypothetical protein
VKKGAFVVLLGLVGVCVAIGLSVTVSVVSEAALGEPQGLEMRELEPDGNEGPSQDERPEGSEVDEDPDGDDDRGRGRGRGGDDDAGDDDNSGPGRDDGDNSGPGGDDELDADEDNSGPGGGEGGSSNSGPGGG